MIRLAIITGLLSLSTFAELPTKGVDLNFISSVKSIGPDSTFTVGLKIHHHPGFHTYWKNPGAVGYPTTINWKLPPGFTAGPIRWPVPEMSEMAGYPVFGYESDVTLLVDLTTPPKLPETPVEIRAITTWMACTDECYPGNKTFTLNLPVAEKLVGDPSTADQFSAAENQIPRELKDWKAVLESKSDEKGIRLLLTPPNGHGDFGPFRFFSSDGQISSDSAPLITKLDDGRIRITAKRAHFSPEKPKTLPFVLVAEKPLSSDGRQFGTLNPAYPDLSPDANEQTP